MGTYDDWSKLVSKLVVVIYHQEFLQIISDKVLFLIFIKEYYLNFTLNKILGIKCKIKSLKI